MVHESRCKYFSPAKYGDTLIVNVFIEESQTAKFTLHYKIIRQVDNKLIAKGSTTHVFVNRDYKLLLNMPTFFSEKFIAALKNNPQLIIKKDNCSESSHIIR